MSKFNNRANRRLTTTDGEIIWDSRSIALVGEVCAYLPATQTWYVLLVKRGEGTPDYQHYWCMPCGYLDWDETLNEGLLREVFEETGLYLPALSSHPHFIQGDSTLTESDNWAETPWAISDNLQDSKQTITLHYAAFFAWAGAELPALSSANAEPNEVANLQWTPLETAKKMSLAFNHHARIRMMCEQLSVRMQTLSAKAHVLK